MKPNDRTESDSASRPLEIRMRDQDDFWISLGLISLYLLILGFFLVDWFRSHSMSHVNRVRNCQEALTRLDGAKEQWSLDFGAKEGVVPTESDLVFADGTGYLKSFPRCPKGDYVIGPVGVPPRCTSGLPGHSLEESDSGDDPTWRRSPTPGPEIP